MEIMSLKDKTHFLINIYIQQLSKDMLDSYTQRILNTLGKIYAYLKGKALLNE